MNWLDTLTQTPEDRQRTKTRALAIKAMEHAGASFKQLKPTAWRTSAPPAHGFAVTLDVLVRDQFVILMAGANLFYDENLLPPELAILLLEENANVTYGSFRLHRQADGWSIAHVQPCDARLFSAEIIADIGKLLITQMQRLIEQLYAKELI